MVCRPQGLHLEESSGGLNMPAVTVIKIFHHILRLHPPPHHSLLQGAGFQQELPLGSVEAKRNMLFEKWHFSVERSLMGA